MNSFPAFLEEVLLDPVGLSLTQKLGGGLGLSPSSTTGKFDSS